MFLMLDLRFESSHSLLFYIIYEKVVAIVKEYDNKSLYPMLIKCYNHLHHVLESKVGCVGPFVEKNYNLSIF
jgi:hypothetical protein